MKITNQSRFASKILLVITFMVVALTYSIMIVGVYISSTHQGFSCQTWPLCPNGFNFPPEKYFFEHFHRFLVLILSLSLFSFTILSFIKIKNRNLSIKLSLASALLIAQILLGWLMIETKLHPIVVASHLATAIALFGILIVTIISMYHEMQKHKNEDK